MLDNDLRREHARARLQARQGRSPESAGSNRVVVPLNDEHGKSLHGGSRNERSSSPRPFRSDKRPRSVGASSARVAASSSPSSRGRTHTRKDMAPMVGNVSQKASSARSRGVVVGRESRGGWSASAYQSEKHGLKAVPGRLFALVRGFFGLIATFVSFVIGLLSRIPFAKFFAPIAMIALLVMAGVKFVPSLLNDEDPESAPTGIVSPDGATPDLNALVSLLGEEDGTALYLLSRFDVDRYWVASHPDSYAGFGEELQVKMLRLAANEWAASGFVRAMIDVYPNAASVEYDGVGSGSLGGYPILYQWDERWGCLPYSESVMGLAGCGPTALSIMYQGLTGKTDMPPDVMASFAANNGYVIESVGSDITLITEGGTSLGLAPAEIDLANDNLIWTLESGVPVVANVGPGDFTQGGHYIVLVGLDTNGKVLVIDPYSRTNTMQAWDVDRLVSQSKSLVAFYA